MICAVVENNVVVNLINADANVDTAPPGTILVNPGQDNIPPIGSIYNPYAGVFTHPTPEVVVAVPESITPRQVRLLLLQQNLLESVEAMVAQQDEATRITWEFASEFRRNDPLLTALAANLGLSSQQIDEFFISASRI